MRIERPHVPAPRSGGTEAVVPRPGPVARLGRAARTAPGRLRLAGALLAVLALAFGALTAVQLNSRAAAAGRVVGSSQPLSQAAADINRSLADADATAATGFLLAGAEPRAVRERYEQDLRTASRLISEAAARTTSSSADLQELLSSLNQKVPVYAGLVESARANNRQGFPLGGAYQRYASEQMRTELLPAAARLSAAQNDVLADDLAQARATPWAGYALGLVALLALAWVQLALFRRTNRVFNIGLLAATASVLAAVLWLTVSATAAGSALERGEREGGAPLRALNAARVDVLTARLAENLHYVSRGSSSTYAKLWSTTTGHLWTRPDGGEPAGTLAQAQALAPADARATVDQALRDYEQWNQRHTAAGALENQGDYQAALDATVTAREADAPNTADAAFTSADRQLAHAAVLEEGRFRGAALGVDTDLRTAAAGVAALGLVAAVAALGGLGRRLAEYR
ncbi:hypothetical protein [Kitasatospora sp. NPDC015120]|uniref:hypothetical protein n=1 Tax=Kitasatospora sp. NPDC015120 TaxID=3364023 RepID=UPI0036F45E15